MRWYPIFTVLMVASMSAAISAAQTPDPPVEDSPRASAPHGPPTQADLLKAQADLATAQKGLLDAELARTEAEQRLRNARIGPVTGQSEIKGTTELGDNSARAEALLMVTSSAVMAGRQVRDAVWPVLEVQADREVLILTSRDELTAPDALVFDMKTNLLRQSFSAAEQRYEEAVSQEPRQNVGQVHALAPLALADTIIGGIARLGSYFRTDYEFGAVQPDLPEELWPAAVIQGFADLPTPPNFVVPSHSLVLDPTAVFEQLRPLQEAYLRAAAHRAQARQRVAALREAQNSAPRLKAVADRYQDSAEALNQAMASFDEFISSLEAGANGNAPPIVRIVRQKQVQRLLARSPSPLALLVTSRPVGAYYTRSNLWTFLGGPPLYTMGGSSTTYTLFDPLSGRVFRSGAIPTHAGYRSVRQVERLFSPPARARR